VPAYRSDAWLRLFAFGLLASFLGAAIVVSFVVSPEDIESGRVLLTPECGMQRLFEMPCLACGLTRGFAAIGHGRFAEAIEYNALSPGMYAAFWLGALYAARGVRDALRDLPRGLA
jgi:hypothetical protein